MIADLALQISDIRFQIANGRSQAANLKSPISNLKCQDDSFVDQSAIQCHDAGDNQASNMEGLSTDEAESTAASDRVLVKFDGFGRLT